jgi:hypothetical protein
VIHSVSSVPSYAIPELRRCGTNATCTLFQSASPTRTAKLFEKSLCEIVQLRVPSVAPS